MWAYNRGGPYVRALGNPNPNPATGFQDAARSAYTDCLAAWTEISPGQRAGWDRLSKNTPELGRGGATRSAGAFPLFIRANQARRMVDAIHGTSLSIIQNAPDTSIIPWPLPLPVAAAADTNAIRVEFPMGTLFPTEDTTALLIWFSRTRSVIQRSTRNVGWMGTDPFLGTGADSITFGVDADWSAPYHKFVKLRLVTARGEVTSPMILDVPAFS